MYKLYWEQKAAARLGADQTDWKATRRGVRQGRVLSPDLFLLYSERRSVEGQEGFAIGGRSVIGKRCAGDTVSTTDSQEKLRDMMRLVEGFAIRGRNTMIVRYAGDTILITGSQEKLRDILTAKRRARQKV